MLVFFRIQHDEECVHRIMETINSMINPWQCSEDGLVSLSSGAVASESATSDLLSANDVGESKLQEFIETRLSSKTRDIFDNIRLLKLKTFTDSHSKPKAKTSSKQVLTERSMFARMIVVARSRSIDLKDVLSYPLSTVPACLSSTDLTSLSKTSKAALLHTLEKEEALVSAEDIHQISQSAVMVDAMAVLQAIPATQLPNTFGGFAAVVLKKLTSIAQRFNARRLDFVGDQYRDNSIKNIERLRRAGDQCQDITIYGPEQKLPKKWKTFMSGAANKARLQAFLADEWKQTISDINIEIMVAVSEQCEQVKWSSAKTPPQCTTIANLRCNHEEADTRLILHSSHAAQTHNNVVILSPDTDVAMLALSHASQLNTRLLFATGSGNKHRVLDLSFLANHMGSALCKALLGFHSFTGCDTVSSFAGKGKKTCYKALSSSPEFIEAFAAVGVDFSISDQLVGLMEKYVCTLYNSKDDNVNQARYNLFCNTTPLEKSLPPNLDALTQHTKRANYQACIWKQSLNPMVQLPSPDENGWKKEDGKLCVEWLTGLPAPQEILKLTHCSCKKTACGNTRCSCCKAQLRCTPLCACIGCQNATLEDPDNPTLSDDDTDFED